MDVIVQMIHTVFIISLTLGTVTEFQVGIIELSSSADSTAVKRLRTVSTAITSHALTGISVSAAVSGIRLITAGIISVAILAVTAVSLTAEGSAVNFFP